MTVFLCGALADPALAGLVLGPETLEQAVLPDHMLRSVCGGEHAVPVPEPGAEAAGLLLAHPSDEAMQRLAYYLAVYGLSLGQGGSGDAPMRLAVLQEAATEPWSDADWRARHAAAVLRAATEIMAHRATFDPEEMTARLAQIRARAELWVKAQSEPPAPGHDPARDVAVQALQRPYMNFFAVQEMDFRFRKHDSTMSAPVNRGAFMLGEASAVLPYDPAGDRVLLIQQFRAALYLGGSMSPWVWEAVAGLVDPGESPQETAHREAMEEAGLTLRHLEPLGPTHGSPGALSDRLNLYIGLTDLTRLADAGGVVSEGEDIRRDIISFDTLMERVDDGHYTVLPLITLALWLARHRDRLRAMA